MLATSVQCRLKQRVTVSLVVEARLVADDAGGYDTKCEPVRTCIPPPLLTRRRHLPATPQLLRETVSVLAVHRTRALLTERNALWQEKRGQHMAPFGRR